MDTVRASVAAVVASTKAKLQAAAAASPGAAPDGDGGYGDERIMAELDQRVAAELETRHATHKPVGTHVWRRMHHTDASLDE